MNPAILAMMGCKAAASGPVPLFAWAFDETSGTVAYPQIGTGNLTITGSIATGHSGNAVTRTGAQTGGAASGAITTTSTTWDGITVMGWFNPAATNAYMVTMGANSSDYRFGIRVPGSSIFVNGAECGFSPAWTAKALGTWRHMAITWAYGVGAVLYEDGVQKATATANVGRLGQISYVRVGAPHWGDANNGTIDDLRIYNTALTSGQVTTAMNTPV